MPEMLEFRGGWWLIAVDSTIIETEAPATRETVAGQIKLNSLASRRYVERQAVYSTWVDNQSNKLVYTKSLDEHIALERTHALLKTHTLIGLGKYALMHY